MLHEKKVAVVISCFNEESQIGAVIETLPEFVDKIVVVNDASKDGTSQVVKALIAASDNRGLATPRATVDNRDERYSEADRVILEMFDNEVARLTPHQVVNAAPEQERLILIENLVNGGKGMAQAVGYGWCRAHGIDCIATMDGDGQMDPSELEAICTPVVRDGVDYVKGNRLSHKTAMRLIPPVRFLGNSILSVLTKMSSGYWYVSDTQTGYSAMSLRALQGIRIDRIYARYGVPNDILVKMNIGQNTLQEVTIRPVYRVGEQSKMKISSVIPRISWLLLKHFFYRLWVKYLFRDFHPLFLLYHFSFLLFLVAVPLALDIAHTSLILDRKVPTGNLMIFLLCSLTAFQSFTTAMWMDIQDNSRLYRQ